MPNKQQISKEIVAVANQKGVDIEDMLRQALSLDPAHGADLACKGVVFPVGTYFRAWLGDRPYWGEVRDGALWVKFARFNSPSAAAESVTHHPTNGWLFWECRVPGSKSWVPLSEMRKATQH